MIQAGTAMIRAGTAIDVRADDVILMASTRISSVTNSKILTSNVRMAVVGRTQIMVLEVTVSLGFYFACRIFLYSNRIIKMAKCNQDNDSIVVK
jgi:hypothetical protein